MIDNFVRGDTVKWRVNLYDASSASVGLSINSATLFFTAKKTSLTASDSSAAIAVSVTSHSSASSGQTMITLTTSDTSVAAGRYEYDLQLVDASGEVTTLTPVPSHIYVLEGVTRRTT